MTTAPKHLLISMVAVVTVFSLSCAHRAAPGPMQPTAGAEELQAGKCWSEDNGDDDAGTRRAVPTRIDRNVFLEGETIQPEAIGQAAAGSVAENCPFGAPRKENNFGPTVIIGREGYALEHSATLKIPLWTCEHIEAAELRGSAAREEWFEPDPELSPPDRAELADLPIPLPQLVTGAVTAG